MDKLVSGGITAALGTVFLVVHSIYPMLSSAYVSGGIGGTIIGAGMMMWEKRLGVKKDVEQLR